MYLVLLFQHRHAINPPNTEMATALRLRLSNPQLEAISFLWFDYVPQFYFFEVIETVRRMALTGLPVVIQGPDQLRWRRVLVLFTAFMFYMMYRECRPYQWAETNVLSNICQIQIVLTLFICMLLGLEDFREDDLVGFQFYGPLLTVANLAILALTFMLQYSAMLSDSQNVSAHASSHVWPALERQAFARLIER